MYSAVKILTRRFLTSLSVLSGVLFSAFSVPAENSLAKPDFAFPQTVEKNAQAAFKKAIAERNGTDALRSAIQLCISSSMISNDSYGRGLEVFDSVANYCPTPYSSLAYLLEAHLYKEIYQSDSYIYNSRKIPSEPVPDNVKEWNRAIFADKILKLVALANSEVPALEKMPVSEISSLLTDYKDAVTAGFSVADFITVRIVDLLKTFSLGFSDRIPFGTVSQSKNAEKLDASQLIMNSIDRAIVRHADDSYKTVEVFFCRMKADNLPAGQQKQYIADCYKKFRNSAYGAYFVNAYAESISDRHQKYDLLKSYKEKFPDAPQIGLVETSLNALINKRVKLDFFTQGLPGYEIPVKVSGANVYNFYILVYKLSGQKGGSKPTYGDLKAMKPAAVVSVKIDSVTPATFDTSVNIPALAPGVYTLVASLSNSSTGILSKSLKSRVSTILVSDLSAFSTISSTDKNKNLYIVSALNQAPLKGVRVSLQKIKNGKKGVVEVRTTDSDGKITVDNDYYYYRAEHNGSFMDGELYSNYVNSSREIESLKANVLTNLSIYHPGDTVKFEVVAYTQKGNELAAAPKRELQAVLFNANYEGVDTLKIATDSYGRTNSEFIIPKSGLLGSWSVRIINGEKWLGSSGFEVADYKSPTFFVTIDSASDILKAGDPVTFKGKAMTYAGMPVANAKLDFEITYIPKWWRAAAASGSYGGATATDDSGNFTISLTTDNLKDTPYDNGAFRITASVTNAAGETQASQPITFSLGNDLYINARIPGQINAGDSIAPFKVVVSDIAGHPVVKKVYYRISAAGRICDSGEFDSPNFMPDLRKIPSGRYAFEFSLNPDFVSAQDIKTTTDSVTIWRHSDKKTPYPTPLWTPEISVTAPSGAQTVRIKVGSTYPDSYILALISDTRKLIEARWMKVSAGIVELPVDAPTGNTRIFVHLLGEHNLDRIDNTVTIIPYVQTKKLTVTTETFRNRVTPGGKESWKFRFAIDNTNCTGLPVAAVMSNKALNAISPFNWSFDPSASRYWPNAARFNFTNIYQVSNNISLPATLRIKTVKYFVAPSLNTYGEKLYQNGMIMRNLRSSVKMAASTSSDVAAVNEMKFESAIVEEEVAVAATSGAFESSDAEGVTDGEPLRLVEMAEAFFMPNLITNDDGIVTVDFTAPDFIGTWQLQLMGFSPDMIGTTINLDAVSAKNVMAQMNAPRFVRTGDLASFAATVYNNTTVEAPVGVTIEIVNPLTGNLLLKKDFEPENVAPSASRMVTAEMHVPADISLILIRVYASMGDNRDGEQTLVPVLPSSTPVVESVPFYIGSRQTDFELKMPEFEKVAKVTLSYCDNPVWECVTALPAMLIPESVNILSKAYALYGNAVSASLFNKYPILIKGVEKLAADSMLESPLRRNAELKTVLLENTPWVNSAASETLRMRRLLEFADPDRSAAAVADMMQDIADARQTNGGWSWCPGMPASPFITARVLHVLASLAEMDCLPDGADMVVKGAFKYLDNEYARQWNESKRKYLPVEQLLNYLADKSVFENVRATSEFDPLESAAMKAIESGWRKFGVADKAVAAILFERQGNHKLSRTILESLRQFASVSTEKGMWFDNINTAGWGGTPLLTTAKVLEAYHLIEPHAPAVEQLRQWLIISKQTQNWGDCRYTAAAIHAVLTTGNLPDFATGHLAEISIGGKAVDFKADAVTGSLALDIDPRKASGKTLKVSRTGSGPAWGGVTEQYVAPILSVKQAGSPQISVKKNVYAVKNDSTGTQVSAGNYSVGDNVRITLTITTDRELDYVAITDPRAACLEPLEQLSDYTSSDGVWYYCEVRNDCTNLFIPYLSKGTHVISYECTVDRKGEYSLGVATAQSQYAPVITAHSAGHQLIIF